MIVRHLLLPGHMECCLVPILLWLSEAMPGVKLNLMDQYIPAGRAGEVRGLEIPMGEEEYRRAREIATSFAVTLVR